jgi:hypothetical protein
MSSTLCGPSISTNEKFLWNPAVHILGKFRSESENEIPLSLIHADLHRVAHVASLKIFKQTLALNVNVPSLSFGNQKFLCRVITPVQNTPKTFQPWVPPQHCVLCVMVQAKNLMAVEFPLLV